MKKIFSWLAVIFSSFALAPYCLAQYGLQETAKGAGVPMEGTIQTRVGQILGAGLSLIGVIFFALMIYGGFLWMTAGGNEKATDEAKKRIMYGVIGLAIILAAYAIASFVVNSLVNATTTP